MASQDPIGSGTGPAGRESRDRAEVPCPKCATDCIACDGAGRRQEKRGAKLSPAWAPCGYCQGRGWHSPRREDPLIGACSTCQGTGSTTPNAAAQALLEEDGAPGGGGIPFNQIPASLRTPGVIIE